MMPMVRKSDHLPDIVRDVQTEIESFPSMLEASVIAAQLQDVRISEGDQYFLYMRNLPGKVQEFFFFRNPPLWLELSRLKNPSIRILQT